MAYMVNISSEVKLRSLYEHDTTAWRSNLFDLGKLNLIRNSCKYCWNCCIRTVKSFYFDWLQQNYWRSCFRIKTVGNDNKFKIIRVIRKVYFKKLEPTLKLSPLYARKNASMNPITDLLPNVTWQNL